MIGVEGAFDPEANLPSVEPELQVRTSVVADIPVRKERELQLFGSKLGAELVCGDRIAVMTPT